MLWVRENIWKTVYIRY